MVSLRAEATYGSDAPLSALSALIAKRCEVLNETAKDAAIATMIDALKSVRAATAQARPGAKTKPQIALRGELVPSFTREGGAPRPCIRNRQGQRLTLDTRVRWISRAEARLLHVFAVRPQHERDDRYLAVATSSAEVKRYEDERSARRKRQYGGLAKRTLGVAMSKLSTRNGGGDNAGAGAVRIAPNFAVVGTAVSGREMELSARSTLDYATLALKGGAPAVDLALKKAANKVAGQIAQALKRTGDVAKPFPAPFPEVKRRPS